MSYRYANAFIDPGLNTLTSPSPIYSYGIYTWGYNAGGQLGIGNTTWYSSPKQVGSLTNWKTIGTGGNFTFAVQPDGTLWCWGQNDQGQLMLGNRTRYSSPKQVGSLTNWPTSGYRKLMGGDEHMGIIKSDGTLWTCGLNANGQLGLGNTTSYSSPKQVGSLTNWSILGLGQGTGSFAAIKTDGTLWTWGNNAYGQLGTGNTTYYSSPKQVGTLTTWSRVAIQAACVAIKTDGTLWSWGYNGFGELANGNTISRSSPVQVGALTNWADVVAGNNNFLAVKTDGTLWSWGYGDSGRLGLGNTTSYSSPKQIGALTTWSKLGAGSTMCFAIKTTGDLWAWGSAGYGQLGTGNITYRSSPVQVGALTTWGQVSCGSLNVSSIIY